MSQAEDCADVQVTTVRCRPIERAVAREQQFRFALRPVLWSKLTQNAEAAAIFLDLEYCPGVIGAIYLRRAIQCAVAALNEGRTGLAGVACHGEVMHNGVATTVLIDFKDSASLVITAAKARSVQYTITGFKQA